MWSWNSRALHDLVSDALRSGRVFEACACPVCDTPGSVRRAHLASSASGGSVTAYHCDQCGVEWLDAEESTVCM